MIDRERPLFDDTEVPVGVRELHERLEGAQVSGLHYLTESGTLPKGWAGLVLEFVTSAALVIMAAPVLELRFQARLVFRWVPAEHIWTRSMENLYAQGKGRAIPDDFLKRNVQGEVIRGVHGDAHPTPEGGDEIALEFVSGARLRVRALPSEWHAMAADMDAQWIPRAPRVVIG